MNILKRNKLELNPETVNEAIQFWLNQQVFKNPVEVMMVKSSDNNNFATSLVIEYEPIECTVQGINENDD